MNSGERRRRPRPERMAIVPACFSLDDASAGKLQNPVAPACFWPGPRFYRKECVSPLLWTPGPRPEDCRGDGLKLRKQNNTWAPCSRARPDIIFKLWSGTANELPGRRLMSEQCCDACILFRIDPNTRASFTQRRLPSLPRIIVSSRSCPRINIG